MRSAAAASRAHPRTSWRAPVAPRARVLASESGRGLLPAGSLSVSPPPSLTVAPPRGLGLASATAASASPARSITPVTAASSTSTRPRLLRISASIEVDNKRPTKLSTHILRAGGLPLPELALPANIAVPRCTRTGRKPQRHSVLRHDAPSCTMPLALAQYTRQWGIHLAALGALAPAVVKFRSTLQFRRRVLVAWRSRRARLERCRVLGVIAGSRRLEWLSTRGRG
jgi:hypothetical protein